MQSGPVPTPDDAPAAPLARALRRDEPPRLLVLVALLAALLLAATPFLGWIGVTEGASQRVGTAVKEAARGARSVPGTELLDDLADRLEQRHELTGLDLLQWSRGARARLRAQAPGDVLGPSTERIVRSWRLADVLVLGLSLLGALLALYLGAHALGRWRPSMRVLAAVGGTVALLTAGGLEGLVSLAPATLSRGPGHAALLGSGLALLGATAGSLSARTALRVLLGTLLVLLGLAGVAWAWLAGAAG